MDPVVSESQLVDFLAGLARCSDRQSLLRAASRLAAGALDAEVGLVLTGPDVRAGTGWSDPRVPGDLVAAVLVARPPRQVHVPGRGVLQLLTAPLPALGPDGRLLVLRAEDAFDPDERVLLRGMAQLLGLSLDAERALHHERFLREEVELRAQERLRLLETLQAREQLLTTLLQVQRAISHREPLEEVLDLIAHGTSATLGGGRAAIMLESTLAPDEMVLAAATEEVSPVAAGRMAVLARAAMREGRASHHVDDDVRLASPVHVQGRAIGALLVRVPAGRAAEGSGLLLAFAEHASMALGDAHAMDTLRQAFYDQLTRLPNRALLLDRLDRALLAHAEGGAGVALLFVDLDGFKRVNDTYGHAAGDLVLQACAARLRDCVRDGDTAARLGGDEFAVLLEGVRSEQEAVAVAERLARSLAQPLLLGGTEVVVGASVGVALPRRAGTSSDLLLGEADLAMYRAKQRTAGRAGGAARRADAAVQVPPGGRATRTPGHPEDLARGARDRRRRSGRQETGPASVVLFEESMQRDRTDRLRLESDLQLAVERGELVVHYQPIVCLGDGQVIGAEALVRWHHPVRGLVPPDAFVAVAEEMGLIGEIGRWVLREACRAAARWGRDVPGLRVSVNVSAQQVEDPRFVGDVRDALAASGLDPRALVLEITESMLLHDDRPILDRLEALEALDVSIAVDDFGTGYSSLSSLRTLPVHVLKIDRSFVQGIAAGEDPALVRAVVQLAGALGLRCVAEGVEEESVAAVLRELGCESAQGYLYSRPLEEGLFRDCYVRPRAQDAAAGLHLPAPRPGVERLPQVARTR